MPKGLLGLELGTTYVEGYNDGTAGFRGSPPAQPVVSSSKPAAFRYTPQVQPISSQSNVVAPQVSAVPDTDNDEGDGAMAALRQDTAQAFGYVPGQSNPLSMIPYVGGLFDSPNYGQFGTTDMSGNVFGQEGRAYDPITGLPAASYKDKGTAFSTVTGGYSKLREAGEDPVSSALGSYENSVYNIGRTSRMAGYTPATQQGITNVPQMLRDNTMTGAYGDDFDSQEITPEMIGIDTSTTPLDLPPEGMSGELGLDPGDVFISGDTYQPYIIDKDGSLVGQEGTLVQTSNPITGESVSLLSPKEGGGYSTAGSNQVLREEGEKIKSQEFHPAYGYTDVAKPLEVYEDKDDNGGSSSGGK